MKRRKARELILQILFQRDFRPGSLAELVEDRALDDPYVREVLQGIEARQAEIDQLIAQKAAGWRLERLVAVDRNILRLAIYEILFRPDVPAEAVIDEAVELAKKFSTEHSPTFINGILDRIWKEHRDVHRLAPRK
jgi:N utilization substance protein B